MTKLKSQVGSLAVQFLFGWVLIMGFVAIFAATTLTLAVIEVTQYITYASAHELFLGHGSANTQKDEARDRYNKLTTRTSLQSFFKSSTGSSESLFKIQDEISIGINPDFFLASDSPNLFMGAWTTFEALILKFDPPLWGKKNSNGEGSVFGKVQIGSYLGREPSRKECREFNEKRWKWIYEKHSSVHPHFHNIANHVPTNGLIRGSDGGSDNGC